jgi:enediyne biosynthesis protein E5
VTERAPVAVPARSEPAPPARASLAARIWERLGNVEPRYLISGLITLILVVGEWRYRILSGSGTIGIAGMRVPDGYVRLALALFTAVGTEWVLSKFLRGHFASVQSAYISGISVSLLTKPQPGLLWPFVLAAALSITSKYVLTLRGRHLWNPTNFGISCLLLVAPASMAILSHEWGNDWSTNLVIWAVGLLIVTRVKVLHITLTYAASFLVLATLRAWIIGGPVLVEIAPITGPMYQLFVFFMVTDPRTVVSQKRWRIVVAILIAVVEMAIRLGNDYHLKLAEPFAPAPAIFALAIVGPLAMVIDLARQPRRAA